MSTGPKRKTRTTINASITIPEKLLKQIKEHVEREDLTVSQYIRRLAKADLEEKAAA